MARLASYDSQPKSEKRNCCCSSFFAVNLAPKAGNLRLSNSIDDYITSRAVIVVAAAQAVNI